ncbi:MAG TPA: phosphoadenylyl-sulfate reductase [Acidimicrobiia bacterium]|jgi:phosphoadenosine phosphosulfate reductase
MSLDVVAARVDLPDLDHAPAESILAYAIGRFSPHIAVACSMQDAVTVDLAVRLYLDIEVFFLDTGFHFPETLETARRLQARYDLNLVVLRPEPGSAVYHRDGLDACCAARKVAPMERYLATKSAWVSGVRRDETPARAGARALEWDAARGIVKVNPLLAWSAADVERYVADHDLPVNPLRYQGYGSIGCAPCTLPGTGREGRWAGTDKLECGLHLAAPVTTSGRR